MTTAVKFPELRRALTELRNAVLFAKAPYAELVASLVLQALEQLEARVAELERRQGGAA